MGNANSDRRNGSVVRRSFRNVRKKLVGNEMRSDAGNGEKALLSFIDLLPVDMQFHIMTFLSPQDLCRLGGTSRYWRMLVRDPRLWRYFMLRDIPHWSSIDHLSMPKQLDALKGPLSGGPGCHTQDVMAEYIKACSDGRILGQRSKPVYKRFTSFLRSLRTKEPRFAMFGPGLEQLEVSLIANMMFAPNILRVVGITQDTGIGAGITFMHKQCRFNVLVIYSSNSVQRGRHRVGHIQVNNELFINEEEQQPGKFVCQLPPHIQEVCQLVDGFIYVANAEADQASGGIEEAQAQIRAMLQPNWGPSSRPLLVLSCVSNTWLASQHTSCVSTAHQLQLSLLPNPWMVQNTTARLLSGMINGVTWLLMHSGIRL
ncbi:F-box only protein 4-like [Denticeps clupeoides]|uniref:F-box domain-containing protein n=1 Tax=Denticeps clupeoides TaxID=299321 RepID=A0AAY4AQI9_9TELE|nr:F-box only protein 4-like [Denticeps clupeoides]